MAISEITPELVREYLRYDHETGDFTRLKSAFPSKVGTRPESLMANGYFCISLGGANHYAHRLAFMWMLGRWPNKGVDHMNATRTDNRWVNLREADQALNMQNRRMPGTNNTHGFLGVRRNHKRWSAGIVAEGVRHYLGTYDSPEEAHAAYLAAKRLLHPGNTL